MEQVDPREVERQKRFVDSQKPVATKLAERKEAIELLRKVEMLIHIAGCSFFDVSGYCDCAAAERRETQGQIKAFLKRVDDAK